MVEADTGQVTRSAAEAYEESFVPALVGQFADPVLEAAEVQHGDHVLDVGCGTGVVARAALRRVVSAGSVTAVYVNPDMLAVAARTTMGIAWRRADAQALPIATTASTRPSVSSSSGSCRTPSRHLRELARVTRPCGRVAVAVWSGLSADPGSSALWRLLGEQLGGQAAASIAAPFRLGDEAVVAELFRAASLDARITEQPGTAGFGSVADRVDTGCAGGCSPTSSTTQR